MTIGDRIRNRRIELGLTQIELANRMGLSAKSTICKVEKEGDNVTTDRVKRFSEALDCSIQYLMGWEEKPITIELEGTNPATTLDSRVMAYAELFTKLKDSDKKIIEDMTKSLLNKDN